MDDNKVSEQGENGWRPIACAPKDGTRVIGWPVWGTTDNSQCGEIAWQRMVKVPGRWVVWARTSAPIQPTHWMPLPEPPK